MPAERESGPLTASTVSPDRVMKARRRGDDGDRGADDHSGREWSGSVTSPTGNPTGPSAVVGHLLGQLVGIGAVCGDGLANDPIRDACRITLSREHSHQPAGCGSTLLG